MAFLLFVLVPILAVVTLYSVILAQYGLPITGFPISTTLGAFLSSQEWYLPGDILLASAAGDAPNDEPIEEVDLSKGGTVDIRYNWEGRGGSLKEVGSHAKFRIPHFFMNKTPSKAEKTE